MTNPNGNRFCTRCGAELPPDTTFCPRCGVPVDGGENPYAPEPGQQYTGPYPLGMTPQMIFLYSIGAVFLAIMVFIAAMTVTEDVWVDMFGDSVPYNPALKTLFIIYGVCLLVSSVMAFLCQKHVKDLTNWKASFNYCLIATLVLLPLVLDLVGIILIAIGGIMTYRIYRYRSYFTS